MAQRFSGPKTSSLGAPSQPRSNEVKAHAAWYLCTSLRPGKAETIDAIRQTIERWDDTPTYWG
eukprot:3222902-Pyramimonas_sp.AAC.1